MNATIYQQWCGDAWIDVSKSIYDMAQSTSRRIVYTEPVIDDAWLEKQLRELYRVTANRTCGWITFVKIGVALLRRTGQQ